VVGNNSLVNTKPVGSNSSEMSRYDVKKGIRSYNFYVTFSYPFVLCYNNSSISYMQVLTC